MEASRFSVMFINTNSGSLNKENKENCYYICFVYDDGCKDLQDKDTLVKK